MSLGALIAGDALLVVALRSSGPIGLVLQVFVVTIILMLRALWRADDPRMEQVAIGLGARMGNGLLVSALAWLALEGEGAPPAVGLLLVTCLAVLYATNVAALAAKPHEALIGYKG